MYEENKELQESWEKFHVEIVKIKYAYNFSWLGMQLIQIPQDIQAMQEIIWKVKPDLIIETGVAMGGSLIFSASMLSLLETCGEIKDGKVIGIEINIFPHNERAIRNHPLSSKIEIIKGSSVNEDVINKVKELVKGKRVLVCLDSNHTHEHVLNELRAYSPLVSIGSYIIVEDTGVENLPDEMSANRPWGKGNNPMTAVHAFLEENDDFEINKNIQSKLIISGNPDGYLRRIK